MKSSNKFTDQFMTKLSNNVFDEEIKRQNEEDKRFIESLIFNKNKLESGE